MNLVIIHCFI